MLSRLPRGKDEPFDKTTVNLPDVVTRYNCRSGMIDPVKVESKQRITVFNYGDKSAVYDFDFEQYFSDIRSSRVVIRGTNGEIVNNTCTYLKDGIPHSFEIKRIAFGMEENLDGYSLLGITGDGKVLYTNPFKNIRFSDEDIAIATCLVKMKEYVENGVEFYSANEAFIDYNMMI